MDFRLKGLSIESTKRETDFGQEIYGCPKLAQPSSFPAEPGRAQPNEVSSASHSSSLLSSAIHSSSLLSSATHSSSLLSSAIHSSSLLSSTRRAQLYAKRSAQPKELSSAQRDQLGQKCSALHKEVSSAKRAQLYAKRSARP